MNKKFLEPLVGKQVEIFINPDIPHTTGIIKACNDDFIVIDDEIWSYSVILGIRQLKKKSSHDEASNKTVQKLTPSAATAKPQQDIKTAPVTPQQAEASTDDTANIVPQEMAITLPDREFSGVLTTFYYERRHWGFIKSEEVKKAGIPLRDGEKLFVHINQITDEALRVKLLNDKNENPNINVIFKLTSNQQGIAADDVREIIHVKINDVVPPAPQEQEQKITEQIKDEPKIQNVTQITKTDTTEGHHLAEELLGPKEDGEIDFYRRYDNPPHGEIRIKGNKLFQFEDIDVIDPVLAVFLEISPSAEGQRVKFIKKMGARGKMKASFIEAAEPFPQDKVKEWEKSGLIEKAKERLKAIRD